MKYAVDSDGSLVIIDLSETELESIRDSIKFFRETDVEVPAMAKKLSADIEKLRLEFDTLSQFSKWCHTAGRYRTPMIWAQMISDSLFGEDELIPRLCDQSDTVCLSSIEEYKNFLIKLMKKGIISKTESKDEFVVFGADENGILRSGKFILI